MSTPILPFSVWEEGTNQNSIPANDNSLRHQILNGEIIADDVTAQPASPSDGDAYIIPAGATGSQWALFDENDLTIYMGGTWYAYAPVEGIRVTLDGDLVQWDGAAYTNIGGLSDAPSDGTIYGRQDGAWVEAGGGASDRSTVTAVTSSSGVVTLDYSLGDYFTLALSENVTSWVITNPPGSGMGFTLMVEITQSATPRTVAKPGTTAGGVALDVSIGSGDVDLLAITSFNNGTTLRSSIAKDFS